jgi:hypothetical protein
LRSKLAYFLTGARGVARNFFARPLAAARNFFACLRTPSPNLVPHSVTAVEQFVAKFRHVLNVLANALRTFCGVVHELAAKVLVAGAARASCGVSYDVFSKAFFAGAASSVSANTEDASGRSAGGHPDIATGDVADCAVGGVVGRAVGGGGSAMPKVRPAGAVKYA